MRIHRMRVVFGSLSRAWVVLTAFTLIGLPPTNLALLGFALLVHALVGLALIGLVLIGLVLIGLVLIGLVLVGLVLVGLALVGLVLVGLVRLGDSMLGFAMVSRFDYRGGGFKGLEGQDLSSLAWTEDEMQRPSSG